MKLSQKLLIIVGMNGSGKTLALKTFEDMGYFGVNALPVSLLGSVVNAVKINSEINLAAVSLDLRKRSQFKPAANQIMHLIKNNLATVVFMNASDQQLIARFKEHRHAHPLSPNHRVVDGIALERKLNRPLKQEATLHIDTTHLRPAQLERKLRSNFPLAHPTHFHVDVMSFGFKYGMPLDADIVEDVRFLPNPFYIKSLKHQNGTDPDVYSYVMDKPVTRKFCRKFIDLLEFSIPGYIKEGKPSLTIAIGCTGGQHRSVTVARKVAQVLSRKYPVNLYHRDVAKSYQKSRLGKKSD